MGQAPDRDRDRLYHRIEKERRDLEYGDRDEAFAFDPANPDVELDDPRGVPLDVWLRGRGTRTGTFTFNGRVYTDLNEVAWRQENGDWATPRPA